MRDGARLISDVWLPNGPGPFPTILVRTPYIRADTFLHHAENGVYFAQHGYAYVVQDVRGRGDSQGEFGFFNQEANDGYDTVEGLAQEPWSNGRLCMMGASYMGTVQWLAAKARPPHLVCIAPTAPAGRFHNELPTVGGAFLMQWALVWLTNTAGHISEGPNLSGIDWNKVFAHRPLITADEAVGRELPLYRQFLQHDTLDSYWQPSILSKEDYERIDIPVMTTAGWFDGDQIGALMYWDRLHKRSRPVQNAYLTLGPWLHPQTILGGAEKIGEMDFGKESIIDNNAAHLAFYDRYLKQLTGTTQSPKVHVFVTGVNEWRNYDAWPVPSAKPTSLFLTSGGHANTGRGDGALSFAAVGGGEDEFVYDPKKPVPLAIESAYAGDRTEIQQRTDVLVYSSPVLSKPIEVIGPVAVELWAASDAKDTDFTAVIEDVTPDGKSVLLGPRPVGIVRARYRDGPEAQPRLLTPGKAELYRIDLGAIGHVFKQGHRVRIEISSSAYPMYNPNQNTGNPIATDTEWNVAKQKIFHNGRYRSALVLPIIGGH